MMLKTLFAVATVVVATSAQDPAPPTPASNASAPAPPAPASNASAPAAGAPAAGAPPADSDPNAVVSTALAQSATPDPNAITANFDGQCGHALNNSTNNQFIVDQTFPKYNKFPSQSFPGAEAPNNSGGWNVWWNTPANSDPTCKWIIMLPYTGFQKPYDGQPPGYEIINVAKQGCYFSNIPVDSEILMTKCCGDACGPTTLDQATSINLPQFNDQAISPGGAAAQPAQGNTAPVTNQDDMSPLPAQQPTGMTKRAVQALGKHDQIPKSGSPATKANALMSRFWYDLPAGPSQVCTSNPDGTPPGTPYLAAGKQIIVSQAEVCQSGQCTVSVTYTNTFGTTITSDHEETFTNGGEASVSVEAGADFIGDAKVTSTLGFSWSKAVTDATGKQIQSQTSVATAYNVQFQAGQRSVLTFTPHLQCWTAPAVCPGDTNSHPSNDYCQTLTSGSGDQTMPVGDYSVLVLDN